MPLPTLRRFSGMKILMASFLKKPSGLPVAATALPVLTVSASFSPEEILESVSPKAALLPDWALTLARFHSCSSWLWADDAEDQKHAINATTQTQRITTLP